MALAAFFMSNCANLLHEATEFSKAIIKCKCFLKNKEQLLILPYVFNHSWCLYSLHRCFISLLAPSKMSLNLYLLGEWMTWAPKFVGAMT